MNTNETGDVTKLPKWAQKIIKHLQMERDVAVRELNSWCDSQTPSNIWIDEYVCTGEQQGPSQKKRYIHATGLHIEHAGIQLDVRVYDRDRISLSWNGGATCDEAALIPTGFQQASIVSHKNMRVRTP